MGFLLYHSWKMELWMHSKGASHVHLFIWLYIHAHVSWPIGGISIIERKIQISFPWREIVKLMFIRIFADGCRMKTVDEAVCEFLPHLENKTREVGFARRSS